MSLKSLLTLERGYHAPDKKLIWVLFILLSFGLVMLFSASSVAGYLRSGSSLYFVKRQVLGMIFGLIFFFVLSRINYHWWRKYALHFLIISILCLVLVFIPGLGQGYGKAQNWINIFGFSLQPSELVKLFFLLYLAAWLEVKQHQLQDAYNGIGPLLVILGVIGFLMLLQPDLGTLSIIFIISLIVYFAAGGPAKHIVAVVLLSAIALCGLLMVKSNKMDRIACYRDPSVDASGACYQISQSLIAVGSGGLWGRGLGQSREKFMYLPEVWCDSIFAVMAEEIGFIFSSLVILLYFYLFYRGYLISQRAPDLYGRILAIGIVSWVMVQMILNVGGIMNFIPMTGVPLPFVSSGGSALMALLSAMGILVNISRQTREVARRM
jgi:cell division protein FtsW